MRTITLNVTHEDLDRLGLDADLILDLLDTVLGDNDSREFTSRSYAEIVGECPCCDKESCRAERDDAEAYEDEEPDIIRLDCRRFVRLVDYLGEIPSSSGITEDELAVIRQVAHMEGDIETAIAKVMAWCSAHPEPEGF